MKSIKTINRPLHRLFIKIEDKSKPNVTDSDGITYVYTKWVEVKECNLGSVKVPNKKILGVQLIPIEYAREEK